MRRADAEIGTGPLTLGCIDVPDSANEHGWVGFPLLHSIFHCSDR